MLIRKSEDADVARIFAVINDAAQAYREVIPTDRWHEPYMPEDELARDKPILIGTWADASWAIDFYRRNGFTVLPHSHKEPLLRTYWSIPERQVETSVVLADRRWMEAQPPT